MDTQDPARLDGWNLRWLEAQRTAKEPQDLASDTERLPDQPPVPGGTTAIRGGKYVREERAPGPVVPPMTDTERLAALLRQADAAIYDAEHRGEWFDMIAARLHAAGVRDCIDPDRLARALRTASPGSIDISDDMVLGDEYAMLAAAIVKAYEEEG